MLVKVSSSWVDINDIREIVGAAEKDKYWKIKGLVIEDNGTNLDPVYNASRIMNVPVENILNFIEEKKATYLIHSTNKKIVHNLLAFTCDKLSSRENMLERIDREEFQIKTSRNVIKIKANEDRMISFGNNLVRQEDLVEKINELKEINKIPEISAAAMKCIAEALNGEVVLDLKKRIRELEGENEEKIAIKTKRTFDLLRTQNEELFRKTLKDSEKAHDEIERLKKRIRGEKELIDTIKEITIEKEELKVSLSITQTKIEKLETKKFNNMGMMRVILKFREKGIEIDELLNKRFNKDELYYEHTKGLMKQFTEYAYTLFDEAIDLDKKGLPTSSIMTRLEAIAENLENLKDSIKKVQVKGKGFDGGKIKAAIKRMNDLAKELKSEKGRTKNIGNIEFTQ